MLDAGYEQTSIVINLHRAPRFGHTSHLSAAASPDPSDHEDYRRGVISFSIFLLSLLFVWLSIILTLKLRGRDRVGCAAGGDVVDISYWRKQKEKAAVRSIVRRSWRVQTVFFVASVLLAVTAALFLRKGIFQISDSVEELQEINVMVETISLRALGITDSLKQAHDSLQTSDVQNLLDLERICPNISPSNISALGDESGMGLQSISDSLNAVLHDVTQLMNDHVHGTRDGLTRVRDATQTVDENIEAWFANQWLAKLFVMLLLVVNGFLLFGLCLSRRNVVHHPTRRILANLLVPSFALLLVASVVTTCTFGMLAVVNADFCAGGDFPGSPIGTIEDIVLQQSANKTDLPYRSFEYYMDSCTTDNPLSFLEPIESELLAATQQTNSIVSLVGDIGSTLADEECGSEVTPIMLGLTLLAENLDLIRQNVRAALEVTSCMSVSPILRRIVYGPICNESVEGLTWAYSTTFFICVLGLTMLSVRAALYNATVKRERKSSNRKRLREWREYKQFMTQFYHDTDEWKVDPDATKNNKEIDLQAASFDTKVTAQSSTDSNDFEEGDQILASEHGTFIPRPRKEYNVRDSYVTPQQVSLFRMPRMDEFEFAYRTRDMHDVMDTEIEPLSPVPVSQNPLTRAPKKPIVSLQRTSQGRLC